MMHLTVQQLSSSLDGALTGPSLELVVRHLGACHDCRDRQARLAKHDDALRRMLGQDPDDLFLDDLTRRSEEQVLAIARGMPAPAMSTSVPLLHEEDPHAPAEPPPPPPRPELGRAGELAIEAGWGRIGLKPTASTHAPESNPEDAQRLLEALENGNTDDFTELTAQGLREHAALDGPVFDLPAWIKEQSKSSAPPRHGPREVPKLNLFFADLDERAAGLTREAVDHVFRRDDESAQPAEAPPSAPASVTPAARTPLSLVPPPDSRVPHGHAAFAPPGWAPPKPQPDEYDDPGPAPEPSRGSATFVTLDPPSEPTGHQGLVLLEPFTLHAPPEREVRPERLDRALVLAIVSVAGLLLILLALQLAPPASRRAGMGGTAVGMRLPKVTLVRKDPPPPAPAPAPPRLESASSAPPVEQVVPPVTPDQRAADGAVAPDSVSEDRHHGIPPVIAPDSAPSPTVTAGHKDATTTRTATRAPSTKPVPAHAPNPRLTNPAPAAATASEEVSWPLLCGIVVDPAGQPVAGARITVTEIAFAMRTDARGHFCLSAPAGTQHLLLEAAGFIETRQAVKLSNDTPELRLLLMRAR